MGVALFYIFCTFLHFLHFFAPLFLRGQVAFSPPPLPGMASTPCGGWGVLAPRGAPAAFDQASRPTPPPPPPLSRPHVRRAWGVRDATAGALQAAADQTGRLQQQASGQGPPGPCLDPDPRQGRAGHPPPQKEEVRTETRTFLQELETFLLKPWELSEIAKRGTVFECFISYFLGCNGNRIKNRHFCGGGQKCRSKNQRTAPPGGKQFCDTRRR
jgi:hypothetical protein